jgi:hypothetical protein
MKCFHVLKKLADKNLLRLLPANHIPLANICIKRLYTVNMMAPFVADSLFNLTVVLLVWYCQF